MEFDYQGRSVGELTSDVPVAPGDHPYEPHRSLSHAMLIEAVNEFGFAEITFGADKSKRRAKISIPEYGVVRILEFLK